MRLNSSADASISVFRIDTLSTLTPTGTFFLAAKASTSLFAMRCLQANVPIATVSAWLGHSDINLTVKRYGRFAAESHAQWGMMARVNDQNVWSGVARARDR